MNCARKTRLGDNRAPKTAFKFILALRLLFASLEPGLRMLLKNPAPSQPYPGLQCAQSCEDIKRLISRTTAGSVGCGESWTWISELMLKQLAPCSGCVSGMCINLFYWLLHHASGVQTGWECQARLRIWFGKNGIRHNTESWRGGWRSCSDTLCQSSEPEFNSCHRYLSLLHSQNKGLLTSFYTGMVVMFARFLIQQNFKMENSFAQSVPCDSFPLVREDGR